LYLYQKIVKIRYYCFLFVIPGAEILLRRREGKILKFKFSILQALCQSFGKGVGLSGFGNLPANNDHLSLY
jgi:hypothetical protein